MKQTIVACLVLLAAVCYAAEKEVDNKQDVVGLLKRLLEKKSEIKVEEKAEVRSDTLSEIKERMMKSLQERKNEKKLTHKFSQFDGNCEVADVFLNSEYGFDGGIIAYPKISKANKDGPCTFHITAEPHQEILFDVTVTSSDSSHCNQLEIHEGSDASGEAHEIICDGSSHNILVGHEAFIQFTEDPSIQSFFVLYGVFDLPSDDSDLHSDEKENENKHHQKHSKRHHHHRHHSKH